MSKTPAYRFPPGLVWIASFPKSGNTWMRILLSNLAAATPHPESINSLSYAKLVVYDSVSFENRSLVEPGLLTLAELERLRPAIHTVAAAECRGALFSKTHDRFHRDDGEPILGTGARAALYLLRDPRDVAVSLAHHIGQPFDRAIASMNDHRCCYGEKHQVRHQIGRWDHHVNGWTGQTRLPVRVIRYEDLRADPVGVFAAAVAFLGLDAPRDALERAVAHADFSELQRQEKAVGFGECTRVQDRFFRSGRVGEWNEVLSPAQVREIEYVHGETMERWGYACSQARPPAETFGHS
jgi:hypothetical protein